ncbi:hypothetical protein Plhal304r1_c031g0100161 [Plasmopara halstedii]
MLSLIGTSLSSSAISSLSCCYFTRSAFISFIRSKFALSLSLSKPSCNSDLSRAFSAIKLSCLILCSIFPAM